MTEFECKINLCTQILKIFLINLSKNKTNSYMIRKIQKG